MPHQANKRIIDATANRMGLDDSKVMVNIERYGNTTSGTIPLVPVGMGAPSEEGRQPGAQQRLRRRLHLGRRVREMGLRRLSRAFLHSFNPWLPQPSDPHEPSRAIQEPISSWPRAA